MTRILPVNQKSKKFLKNAEKAKNPNAFLDVFSEYTEETSIHGMKYLGKGKCVVR